MAKKLKIDEIISEKGTDFLLMGFGLAVIVYALYLGGVFNGKGKIIDASDRFTGKNKEAGNSANSTGNTLNSDGDTTK